MAPAHPLSHLPYHRLKKWVSKNQREVELLFRGTVDRVVALHLHCDWSIKDFFSRAGKSQCSCSVKDGQYHALVGGVEWHDRYEFYGDELASRAKLGEWFFRILGVEKRRRRPPKAGVGTPFTPPHPLTQRHATTSQSESIA